MEDFQTLWVVMSDDHMCKVVKREGTINYLFRCWEQTKILNSIFGIENLSCKGSKNSLTEEFYQKGFLLKHAILKSTLTPITQKLHRKALAVVFWNRQSRIFVPNLSLWWLKAESTSDKSGKLFWQDLTHFRQFAREVSRKSLFSRKLF